MCRLQWATLIYLVGIIIIIDNFSSSRDIGVTANVNFSSNANISICNSSVMISCECGYYRDNTSCIAYTPPIGISTNVSIPDLAMTSSSNYDERHAAHEARLHKNSSAWCANDIADLSRKQYLQVNLGKVSELSRIATQGMNDGNMSGYVTSYKILYSLNANDWHAYQETYNSSEKIFSGNQDAFNVSCNELNTSHTTPLVARLIRIYPVTWVRHMCIRMELYGVSHKCPTVRNTCSINSSCAIIRNDTVCWCNNGFLGDGFNCTDNDECITLQTDNPCHSNSVCVNTPGSFKCECKQGYHGDTHNCTDIDECLINIHSCSPNAQCLNSDGSYSCQCIPGYHDNGQTCEDVNECSIGFHDCHGNASCINKNGTYTCSCRNGFEGDGRNCTDIDECRWWPSVCHVHAECLNTAGSHECRCLAGYTGNGHNCTVLYSVASTRTLSPLFLGIVIGLPVVLLSVIILIICGLLFTRHRRNRVTRRPRSTKVSRPSSTVIGQIDQLFDEENTKRSLRDSVSLRSLQFSIPSVHPSLVALNNIGLATPSKATPTYETL